MKIFRKIKSNKARKWLITELNSSGLHIPSNKILNVVNYVNLLSNCNLDKTIRLPIKIVLEKMKADEKWFTIRGKYD